MEKSLLQNKKYKILRKPILGLIIIIISSIFFKLLFFPLEIPLILDSLDYYFFAMDIKITGEIPNYSPSKVGWPFFLSIIFSMIPSNETFVFMEIQKLSSIIISSLTVIPIFYLSQIFISRKYSIIAAGIFVFDPRVGINSSIAGSDPLFVLLLITALTLFLKTKDIFIYISFLTVGLASIVRPEGIFLFFAMTILYFIKNRKNIKRNLKYFFCLAIFFSVLFPVLSFQESIHGNDLLFDRIEQTVSYHSQDPQKTDNNSGIPFILKGIENFPKYFGWVLIPNFIIFVPIGFILFIKKIDFNRFSLILSGIFLSIPIFYAYAIPLQDTRYLLTLYPLFSILSIFTIKKMDEYFQISMIVPIVIVIVIILSSVFLFFNYDRELELDKIKVVQFLNESPKIVNEFYPQSAFLETTNLPKDIEGLRLFTDIKEEESLRHRIPKTVLVIVPDFYKLNSINELIIKKSELTHIVIEENNSIELLSEIYNNEEKFEFLNKIFDSG